MPTFEAAVVTKAPPDAAFAAWIDVARWTEGDAIESAEIDGDFAVGATIKTKTKGFPASTLKVTRVEPPRVWTDESSAPGVRMVFDHVVEPVGDGSTTLTERVTMSGPLGGLAARLVRRRLLALFTASATHVARQAETAPLAK